MRKINKKCIKLIVLISILVVIPSVCFAVDNGNETDINHKIVAINEQTEVYVSLDGDNNNNGTIDNPKLTLDGDKGAIAYANSLNITTILLGNGTFIFDRIEINKNVYSLDNLIIKGSGSTIISASGYNNIFNIGLKEITSKPMNITFYNIDFTNSDYYFPAISNYHSYLTIINCNFYGNKAQSSASCIGNFYNSTLEIYNSKFYDNNDENSYGVIESSSAEFSIKLNLDNNIYIENCQFFNNSAESGGVIINIADGLNVFLSVINSNFTNNSVNGEGGAIYIVAFSNENIVSSAIANISECIFENNFAKSAGGAIYTGGNAILSVSSSKFYNNYVSNKLEISNSGVGGAIFAGAGSVIIANSEFSYNSASKGGAIFNTMSSDIIIIDSSFNSNEANIGGAVYMDLPRDYGQYSAFNNLTFDSNIANIGEAIFSNDLNRDNEGLFEFFNCSNSSFKNNNVYNVGNLGLLNNNFTNSNIINTGVLITDGNDYYNSSINNIDNQLNITFLNNVSGYFGDIVKIQANVSNILPNNIIVFVIGLKEYISIYNESSKLYEFDYKILSGNDLKGYGYSLLDNDADSNEFIIKVLKLPVDLVLQIDNIYEGDKLNISVFLSSNNTLLNANVVVVVNNKNYNVFVKNGHGNISIADDSLKIGAYNATASYGRNSFQYEYTNTTKIFYVVSNDVIIIDSLDGAIININNVSGYFLDNAVIIANISKDGKLAFYNKPLQFKIGNQIINSVFNETSKNYNANFVINQNKTSKITVYTNETPIVNEGTFTLLKYQTNINLIIQDIIFNHTALVVNINLTSEGRNINGIVNLNISNTSYIVNINDGKGKYEIFNLDIGNYTAIAKYDGSDIYNTSSASLDFKVLFNSKLTTIISKILNYIAEMEQALKLH